MRESYFKDTLLSASSAEAENNVAFVYSGHTESKELPLTSDLCSRSQSQVCVFTKILLGSASKKGTVKQGTWS